jgi:hypothetical protein
VTVPRVQEDDVTVPRVQQDGSPSSAFIFRGSRGTVTLAAARSAFTLTIRRSSDERFPEFIQLQTPELGVPVAENHYRNPEFAKNELGKAF